MKEKILVVAAHPDDEILGCGGTISKKVKYDKATVKTLILSKGVNARENIKNIKKKLDKNILSAKKANEYLGVKSLEILDFPDNQFDKVSLLSIIKEVEKRVKNFKPDIIFTHFSGDLNIDHQITNRAVMTACRPVSNISVAKIYAFEISSSTEWSFGSSKKFFNPNHFEDVSTTIKNKINSLKFYKNEMRRYPHSRSLKNVENLAKVRGSSVFKKYAEAFILLRSIS
jgi:LmbE family N-acetylglucosaminyl deacetylase